MECRNDGILGSGKMGIGYNGEILLDIGFNDASKERPLSERLIQRRKRLSTFQYSMYGAEFQTPINTPKFNKL